MLLMGAKSQRYLVGNAYPGQNQDAKAGPGTERLARQMISKAGLFTYARPPRTGTTIHMMRGQTDSHHKTQSADGHRFAAYLSSFTPKKACPPTHWSERPSLVKTCASQSTNTSHILFSWTSPQTTHSRNRLRRTKQYQSSNQSQIFSYHSRFLFHKFSACILPRPPSPASK